MTKQEGSVKESTPTREFNNDQMDVVVTQDPGCQVKFEIFVKPEKVKQSYKQALKKINKEVSLPGYRKGKAPDALIKKNYGKYVDQECQEIVLHQSFSSSIQLVKLYPLNNKSVKKSKVESYSLDDGCKISFEFESEPEVPEIAYADLKIEKVEPKEITDDLIQETVERLRNMHAKMEEVTDRPVKDTDAVTVDIDIIDDPAENVCSNESFEVSKDALPEWQYKLIVGAKIDEPVEGMSALEGEYSDAEKKEFKARKHRITVKTIKERILAEVDEEFAKKLGYKDVEEFNAKVVEHLNKEEQQRVENEHKTLIEAAILDSYDFDLPASIVEAERKNRVKERIYKMKQEKKNDDDILASEESVESDVATEVSKELRMFFIRRKVADEAKISVSDNEVHQELARQLWGVNLSQLGSQLDMDALRNRIHSILMTTKVDDYFLSQVKIG